MSDLIEKVARAICRKMWNEHYLQADMRLEDIVDGSWAEYTEEARTAIAAAAEWLEADGAAVYGVAAAKLRADAEGK